MGANLGHSLCRHTGATRSVPLWQRHGNNKVSGVGESAGAGIAHCGESEQGHEALRVASLKLSNQITRLVAEI